MRKSALCILVLIFCMFLGGCEKNSGDKAVIPNDGSTKFQKCGEDENAGEMGTVEEAEDKYAKIPTENNQSNFGSGYGYQYGMDDTIEVLMDGKWYVYENGSGEGKIQIDGHWYDKGFLGKETLASPWGVTFSTKNVTKTGLTLVCTQSGGDPTGSLETGSFYALEILKGNTWEKVPFALDTEEVNYAWTMEAWIIPINDSVDWQVDWSFLYGELSEGVYRIKKEITDFRKTGDYDKQMCYGVFTIEE